MRLSARLITAWRRSANAESERRLIMHGVQGQTVAQKLK